MTFAELEATYIKRDGHTFTPRYEYTEKKVMKLNEETQQEEEVIEYDYTITNTAEEVYNEWKTQQTQAPKLSKIAEMNAIQQTTIANGIDVVLSTGVEHFQLTANDQASLMALNGLVAAGQELIPWHSSDNNQHCKFYSNADMLKITTQATEFISYQVTYFRDLRIYINSLTAPEEIEAVTYGMDIPVEFQSEVLKTMIQQMQAAAQEVQNAMKE